jgi:pilus assembly protein Flp/PilA
MKSFIANESGASLVEYGLLVGLIAVASIVAVQALGQQISGLFNDVRNALDNVVVG